MAMLSSTKLGQTPEDLGLSYSKLLEKFPVLGTQVGYFDCGFVKPDENGASVR